MRIIYLRRLSLRSTPTLLACALSDDLVRANHIADAIHLDLEALIRCKSMKFTSKLRPLSFPQFSWLHVGLAVNDRGQRRYIGTPLHQYGPYSKSSLDAPVALCETIKRLRVVVTDCASELLSALAELLGDLDGALPELGRRSRLIGLRASDVRHGRCYLVETRH